MKQWKNSALKFIWGGHDKLQCNFDAALFNCQLCIVLKFVEVGDFWHESQSRSAIARIRVSSVHSFQFLDENRSSQQFKLIPEGTISP